MPWDPADWESDEARLSHPASADEESLRRSVSVVENHQDIGVEQAIEEHRNGSHEEHHHGEVVEDSYDEYYGDDDVDVMEVDSPQLPTQHNQNHQTQSQSRSESESESTPKAKEFKPLAPLKNSQVQVILRSSPRREYYAPAPEEIEDEHEEEEEVLITSDLLPKPKKVHPSPLKTTTFPSPKQERSTENNTPLIQPKKRGRPKGWKPGTPYSAGGQGSGSSTPRPVVKKPPGQRGRPARRPPKNPALTSRQLYLKLNPHFFSFGCEWEGCPAQLHNLETLRRHILVVHGRPPPPPAMSESGSEDGETEKDDERPEKPTDEQEQEPSITCKWAKCSSSSSPTNQPPTYSLPEFPAHVESAHIQPYLWHAGDGPQNTSGLRPLRVPDPATDPLPSYLFDEEGKLQLTPSVRDQQVENDEDRKRRQAKVYRVLQTQAENAPDEPEYTHEEEKDIHRVKNERSKRIRMFREYAHRMAAEAEAEAAGVDGQEAQGQGHQGFGGAYGGHIGMGNGFS
ncbi:hypothetical protein QBC35DRAFT_491804 [Podospora australis]|uniref:C2H2-type domain-containing protein n=1 Tax=Podospora australis TaxID=1536484 RepID=A0AAN7AKG9_9PEZI|nr:hypothetical protein QBC35DRAFT_491804 [Podospora australis]